LSQKILLLAFAAQSSCLLDFLEILHRLLPLLAPVESLCFHMQHGLNDKIQKKSLDGTGRSTRDTGRSMMDTGDPREIKEHP
jgi:hypothetical protein